MKLQKRDSLLRKIEAAEQKIKEKQAELDGLRKELTHIEKDELYRAATGGGLTVEKAIVFLSELSEKGGNPKKPPHQNY